MACKKIGALDYLNAPAPATSQQLADAWRPYASTCLELFGADRCLVESNFPVDKMGIGYAGLFNALKRIAAGWKTWAADPDGWLSLLHGEIICRA